MKENEKLCKTCEFYDKESEKCKKEKNIKEIENNCNSYLIKSKMVFF